MSRYRRTILALTTAFALGGALAVGGVAPAAAYGSLAQWQVGLSFNCDNPTLCLPPPAGQGLGGFWGWVEFDSNNTGDAELTGCSHFQGGLAAFGADHFSANITSWSVVSGTFRVSGFLTFTGRTGGPPVTVPFGPIDTGIPAVAGHFSSQTLFGMAAPPGTNFEVQVVKLS